jgi:hypothetical protein
MEPGFLEELPSETWSKWASIILAYPESPSSDLRDPIQQIIDRAYSNSPESFFKTLDILIDKENEEHGFIFITQKLDAVWDDRLVDWTLKKITDKTDLKPEAVSNLLKKPMELDFPSAMKLAVSSIKPKLEKGGPERERARYCAALILTYGGETGWQTLKPIFDKDVSFGKEAIGETAKLDRHIGRIVAQLSERTVADLYIWIVKQFPPSEDPKHNGGHWIGERETVAMFRDSLLQKLREKGTPNAVEAIRHICESMPQLRWIKYVGLEARQIAMRGMWEGHSPHAILELVREKENVLVDNGPQLLKAVMASLSRFQSKLHDETPAVYDLWNENNWTPKKENSISNRIKRHLQEDLKDRRIIVNREVEIRKGQETDIHIDAISSKSEIISMIIEVKGCWHRDLETAMGSQLRDRYLRENHCTYGLYLVAWFRCTKWNDGDYRKSDTRSWTFEEARGFFAKQAEELSLPGEDLRAFVLDAALR